MKLAHVSFSTKKFENLQRICFNNLVRYKNIDFVIPFTRDWLEATEFYSKNKSLLDKPRAADGSRTVYRDWETDRKSTRLNSSHRL